MMWVRNVQMGCFSALFYFAQALLLYRQDCPIVINWHIATLTLMQANVGILSALMILHAGAVEKTLATAFSILITNGLEHAYFDHNYPPTLEIVFSLLVADGIVTYTFDTPPKATPPKAPPEAAPAPRRMSTRRSWVDVPIESDYSRLNEEPEEEPEVYSESLQRKAAPRATSRPDSVN